MDFEEVSLLLADLTWLYGTSLRVTTRYRDGDGKRTHVASVELLPAACPAGNPQTAANSPPPARTTAMTHKKTETIRDLLRADVLPGVTCAACRRLSRLAPGDLAGM